MMDFGHDFLADDKVHVLKVGANYRFGYGPRQECGINAIGSIVLLLRARRRLKKEGVA